MRLFLPLIVLFFLVGCGGSSAKPQDPIKASDPYAKPAWIDNPRTEGNIVGLGISKSHFGGAQAQRTLAISRATEEIARQLGVTVQSQSLLTESTQRGSAMESVSLQSVDGKQVKATIKHEWHDKMNDIFYILMVAE